MITKFEDVPPCDCKVIRFGDYDEQIEFCPLHNEAHRLFEALQKFTRDSTSALAYASDKIIKDIEGNA